MESTPIHSPDTSDPYQGVGDLDTGEPGTSSVPQLLRLIRTNLLSHTDVLTESHDRIKPSVSTVMGSFETKRLKPKSLWPWIKNNLPSIHALIAPERDDDEQEKDSKAELKSELVARADGTLACVNIRTF